MSFIHDPDFYFFDFINYFLSHFFLSINQVHFFLFFMSIIRDPIFLFDQLFKIPLFCFVFVCQLFKIPLTNPNHLKHSQIETLDFPLTKPKRQSLLFMTVVVFQQQH